MHQAEHPAGKLPRARSVVIAAVTLSLSASIASAVAPSIEAVGNLTVEQIIADYAAGKYTPTELVQSYLARIAKYEPTYNAFVTMNPNALSDAQTITAAFTPEYRAAHPLAGVPIAIKDSMNVAGLRTTVGSSYFGATADGSWLGAPTGAAKTGIQPGAVEMIPATDSAQVARLRAAGAIIIGKTSINDFALTGNNATSTLNGTVGNAYNPMRTPGGSSGGSGVAVAAGFVPLATAEETGSSITNPSSANGIVGIKPTFGTVPSSGVYPLQGYFRDTDGTFGKTTRDAARMLDVEAGPSSLDPKPSPAAGNIPPGGYVKYIDDHPNALTGARIGVYDVNGTGFNTTVPNAETKTLFSREVAKIQAAGATVVSDPFVGQTQWRTLNTSVPSSNTQTFDVDSFLKSLGSGAAFTSTDEYDAKYSAASGKTFYQIPGNPAATLVNGVINHDDPATRADLDAYRTRRSQLQGYFKYIMEMFDLDALVLPQLAAPVGTFNTDGSGGTITRTPGASPNIMGTPGIVEPGGYYADGTPFAMYFIGDLNTDASLYALGADYEAKTLNRIAPTLVPEPTMFAFAGVALLGLARRRRATAS